MFAAPDETMVSVAYTKNKKELAWVYNLQHIVLVSKCRFKVFKSPKTQAVVADAFREMDVVYLIPL